MSVGVGLSIGVGAARAQAPAQETNDPIAFAPVPGSLSAELPRANDEPALPSTSADYETAIAHALDAHARGDLGAARIFLERAHAIEPSARTLRGLGIVAFSQARHIEAVRYLEAALASDVKPLPPDLRVGVQELLTHAWGQVGRLEITLEPSTGDFLVDGRMPELYAPRTVVLTAGEHVLKARASGFTDHVVKLAVKPGDNRALQIVLARVPKSMLVERIAPNGAEPSALSAEARPFWSPRARRATWSSGALLVAAGIGAYAAAYTRLDSAIERCREMVDGTCSPARARELYGAQHVKLLATTAVALLGTGALVWLAAAAIEIGVKLKSDRRSVAHSMLRLGPGQLSVHGQF